MPAAPQQGEEEELLLAPGNAYQRLLQYQSLRQPQFGAPEPPGFYVEVRRGNGAHERTQRGAREVHGALPPGLLWPACSDSRRQRQC